MTDVETSTEAALSEIREAMDLGYAYDGGDRLAEAVDKLLAIPVEVVVAALTTKIGGEVVEIPESAIIVLHPEDDTTPEDVHLVARGLVERFPQHLIVSLPGDQTIDTLDDEGMRRAGWVRAEPPGW
jgi:hypothetical protein